jgi:SAM-dependent methyltransferase
MVGKRKELYERELGHPISSVLEIGCGHGAWAEAWHSVGCDYTGIEYIPKIAEWARDRTKREIISGDFMDLVHVKSYDVAYFSQVLEHVGKPVPNHDSFTSFVRKLAHPKQYGFIQPPYHLRAYTPDSLKKIFETSGYKVVKSEGVRNDHRVFGQLNAPTNLNKIIYGVSELFGRSSLLVALAHTNTVLD